MSQADSSALYRRIAGNTVYLILGQALGSLGLFASYVIASRFLTRGEDTTAYDAYILAINVGVFFLSLAELGLTEGTTRLVASLAGQGRQAAIPTVARRALAILFVAGGAACRLSPGRPPVRLAGRGWAWRRTRRPESSAPGPVGPSAGVDVLSSCSL